MDERERERGRERNRGRDEEGERKRASKVYFDGLREQKEWKEEEVRRGGR